jgi:hypothetical protein
MTQLGVELCHGAYETTRRSMRTLIIVSPQQEADLFLRNDCSASSRGLARTASEDHLILPPFHQYENLGALSIMSVRAQGL